MKHQILEKSSRTDSTERTARLFRVLASWALRHSGDGYYEAFKATQGSSRFFEGVSGRQRVLMALSDVVTEAPEIAPLAIRGAMLDSDPIIADMARLLTPLLPSEEREMLTSSGTITKLLAISETSAERR